MSGCAWTHPVIQPSPALTATNGTADTAWEAIEILTDRTAVNRDIGITLSSARTRPLRLIRCKLGAD